MSQRNLREAFRPRSVAVVGASPREGSVGRVVLQNIIAGGFAGPVYPVNLKHEQVLGLRCYHRLSDTPEAPDLAVICTPPSTLPGLIAELGECGGRAAVVITAGSGQDIRQSMLDAAQPYLLRIIGPNTIGLLAPPIRLNASFTHLAPIVGRLGLISQSGAIVSSLVDWAVAEGIGFSQILSLGDMADVDVGDCLDMLAADPGTSAILMYLESIPAPRKFMSAARAAARLKPVIAVKPGRHAAAAKAAQTHTGALAGADRVVDAALRRAGIIRVNDLEELFDAAEVTARFRPLPRARVAIVTNGGGAGVLAVDQLLDDGCALAELAPGTIAALDTALPTTWSHANPIDIIGDAPPERYRAAVQAAAADPGVDALLVMNCPTALASPLAAATAVAALTTDGMIAGKPVLSCWLGKQAAEPARVVLQAAGIASLETPAQAARAVAFLARWSELNATLRRVPPSSPEFTVDRIIVASIISVAAAEGRRLLTEPEAKTVLAAYGIPVPETVVAGTEAEVVTAAAGLLRTTPAVVVKMLSRTISHKSDLGGVVLDIRHAEAAGAAAAAIRSRVERSYPAAALDGFTVQPMVSRPGAHELIAGIATDQSFGPTLLFGAGGTAVEVIDDTATGLLPVDDILASDLVDRTRISRLLAGYRDRPPADRHAILGALTALSHLAVDFPAIVAVDINPLLADSKGVIALDARIEIDPALSGLSGPNPRLAIRPYPSGREARFEAVGHDLLVRPIRPEDAALYPAFLERVDAEDIRRRFLTTGAAMAGTALLRLSQLDYDREMAFIAVDSATGQLCGIVNYAADPDRTMAEFALLVRSDLGSIGIGTTLMRQLIAFAGDERIGRLEGIVLRTNQRMLDLCAPLGFKIDPERGDDGVIGISLQLPSADRRHHAVR